MAAYPAIAAVGAGRMGRGIAIVFAYAGYNVRLIDVKARDAQGFQALRKSAGEEIRTTLAQLADFQMIQQANIDDFANRVTIHPRDEVGAALADAAYVFEAVPETLEAKQAAFELICRSAKPNAIVASTTSTILSTDLEKFVSHPERFLNAHWLNPAFLIPLVELSPCSATSEQTTQNLRKLLEKIGKVPVICSASPGYIVPRLQVLTMNEAARMFEEGVASAEDIDKATKYGFGFRFAILGLLEFIDWGGGDILYYASKYMTQAAGEDRFAAPEIVERNMAEGRNGLRDGKGFLNYEGMDVPAYQRARLEAFVELLRHMKMLPQPGEAGK